LKALVIGLLSALAAVTATSGAIADRARAKPKPRPWYAKPVERDCTPINGRFGYYGNPWCDTGSSRPPDIQFRERHRSGYW